MNKTVAIIGAGQMGSGIAQTVAAHGMDVLLADVSLDVAERFPRLLDQEAEELEGVAVVFVQLFEQKNRKCVNFRM